MAARRLIVILVLLLGASVVAASLAPNRTGRLLPSSTTTTTAPEPRAPEPSGASVPVRIEASLDDPKTVEGFVGDQLAVTVDSETPRTIAIEALGLSGFAAPDAPARFDLLLSDPGTIPITDGQGEVVGRLQVTQPAESKPDRSKPDRPKPVDDTALTAAWGGAAQWLRSAPISSSLFISERPSISRSAARSRRSSTVQSS